MVLMSPPESQTEDLVASLFTSSIAKPKSIPQKPFRQFNNYVLAICMLGFEILFGGAIFMKNDLAQSWVQQVEQLKWMVLVNGTELEVDEVGANLRKVAGTDSVTLLSPTEVFQQLEAEGLAQEIRPEYLPVVWEIKWIPAELDLNIMTAIYEDILLYPGVMSVARNPYRFNQILTERHRWFQVRMGLAGFSLFAVLSLILILGRFFLYVNPKNWSWKLCFVNILFFGAFWVLGAMMIKGLWGDIGVGFIALGLLPGFVKTLWVPSSTLS